MSEQYETYRHRIDVLNARLAALGFPRCACHPAEDDSEHCLPDPARWLTEVKAEALRDASKAANRDWMGFKDVWGSNPVDQAVIAFAFKALGWINARADRIERGES